MTGKPARQYRSAWVAAWEREDAPDTLPMPLQGLLSARRPAGGAASTPRSSAATRRDRSSAASTRSARARDLVLDMVEGYIEATARLDRLAADAGA